MRSMVEGSAPDPSTTPLRCVVPLPERSSRRILIRSPIQHVLAPVAEVAVALHLGQTTPAAPALVVGRRFHNNSRFGSSAWDVWLTDNLVHNLNFTGDEQLG